MKKLSRLNKKSERPKPSHAHLAVNLDECSGSTCADKACTPDCPSFDLCKKRVLLVGGIERMECLYRKFIETRGGVFEYHAGHTRTVKALERCILRADVVLCPVNCNSHGACLMVKNLGKKHNKPVKMLPNFGLSTVSRVISELSAN